MIERYDKLDCMLFAAAKDFCREEVENFKNLDVSDVPETPRYVRKRKRMIAKQRRKPVLAACRRFARSVAVILIIIFSLGFITVMSVSAFRSAVIGVIVDWFEDYVQVVFCDNDKCEENVELVIEDLKRITGLPEGVVEKVTIDYEKNYTITYYLEGTRLCSLRQEVYWNNKTFIDNESLEIEELSINGQVAHLFVTENNVNRLYWNDGEYSYILSTFNEESDIIKLAESIE